MKPQAVFTYLAIYLTPIAPELIDEIVKLELTNCPDCQQQLDLVDSETKTFQQITLVEKPIVVTEYRRSR